MNHEASAPAPAGLVSEKELAPHLRVSRRHIRNLRQAGLPFIQLGKCVRFDLSEVEHYLRTNRRLLPNGTRQQRHETPGLQ